MPRFSAADVAAARGTTPPPASATSSPAPAPAPPSGGSGRGGLRQALGLALKLHWVFAVVTFFVTALLMFYVGQGVGALFWIPGKVVLDNGPHATAFWRDLWGFIAFIVAIVGGFRMALEVNRVVKAQSEAHGLPDDASKEDKDKAQKAVSESREKAKSKAIALAIVAVVIGIIWMVPRHTMADDRKSLAGDKSFGNSQVSMIQHDYDTATGAAKDKVAKILADAKRDNKRLQSLQLSGLQPWVLKEAAGIKNTLLADRMSADQAVGKGKA